jgi:hypothetical protein
MKAVAIQKAVNIVKSNSWTSPIDFDYLDETSQFKFEKDRIGAQKRGQVYTPKPWDALPYLAKEELGKIYVRGFLHDDVAQNSNGSFSSPSSFSTEEIIRRLSRAWKAHAKKSRDTEVTHHRLVFSVSNEFHDTLVAAGRNPDMALRGIIEKTMRSFQEKFHPSDSVGYSYGLHHDTDNLHAHVFIHPRTREGAFVGMSGKPAKHQGHASRHKDQLGFLHENVRQRVTQVLKEISDPKAAAYLKSHLLSDQIFFVPRHSHTWRAKNDFRPKTPADYQLELRRSAVAALNQQIAAKRIALREAAQGRNIASIFRIRQPKWLRHLESAYTAKLFREKQELQAHRYRLYSEYRAARRRWLPAPEDTKTIFRRKKQAKASAPSLTPRGPKPVVKPTVTISTKSTKSKIRF